MQNSDLEGTTKKKDIPFLFFSINVCQWGGLVVCFTYMTTVIVVALVNSQTPTWALSHDTHTHIHVYTEWNVE